jgi:hypothetical protein
VEAIDRVIKALLDAHAGDPQLLAVQLKASPASVQRWLAGEAKPRPAYEAKIRQLYSELLNTPQVMQETAPLYRVTPHHPMITEAVDQTLRSIREILHKRGRLSSRSQALDELSKLLFAHLGSMRAGRGGISRLNLSRYQTAGEGLAACLKRFADETVQQSLPESLAHEVDLKDFELKLKPQEEDLALELVECFETLHRQTHAFSFSGLDILNEVFGKFLADSFIDEKELGQYLTPPEVVRFMVRLALHALDGDALETLCNPKRCADGGLILDPSCGVASFLAETVQNLRERVASQVEDPKLRDLWLRNMLENVVVGIDKSERMVRLALTNFAMFGFPMTRLHLANSLARNGGDARLADSLAGKVRLILTNPPFGACFQGNDLVKYKIATTWSRRFPGRLDSEILFMERYLDWLAPGGHLVVVVPDSILTNQGVFEDLRRAIARAVELRTVVSLPTETFGVAGTTTKTSVLHLRKRNRTAGETCRTAFAICQDIGFSVATRANQRTKVVHGTGDLPTILEEIAARAGQAGAVKFLENATRFPRWDAQHHASLSAEIEQRLNLRNDSDLRVSDLADLVDERADPRRWGTKEFNYIEISDIDSQTCRVYSNRLDVAATPSRARKLVRAGDILVSTVRPERGTVGIVGPHQDGSVCTTGLAVLRPTKVDPLTLAHLLRSEFVITQLMRNNVGIAYPAIDESCLLDVLLPVCRDALPRLEDHAKKILSVEEHLHHIRTQFLGALRDAEAAWRQAGVTSASKLPPAPQTKSRHQSRKSGSDSREPDIFQPAGVHMA